MYNKFWWVKWTVWEFLPMWIANIPVYLYVAWFVLRARNLFFFTNVNPAIPLGGAMGESKSGILDLLPKAYLPRTVVVEPGVERTSLDRALKEQGIEFPVIAKPDVGERGYLIQKISTFEDLIVYLNRYPVRFIIQELLQEPLEFSVLFHRFPETPTQVGRFAVTSVCAKEFLKVRGDGVHSIRQLMGQTPRAAFQIARFESEKSDLLEEVPAEGVWVLLEPIGNHARGAKFLNANRLIDAQLNSVFEPLCTQIPGVLYGRFDLKCESEEALRQGLFKIMELNGVLGEPAHIYDPSYGMWRAYRDLYRHWLIIFKLHRVQLKLGIRPSPFYTAWGQIRAYFRYKAFVKDAISHAE